MKKFLKQFLKEIIPTFVLKYIRYINNSKRLKGNFISWDEALKQSTGYDAEIILKKVLSATLKVKSNDNLYERDSVLFNKNQNSFPLLAALLYVAAKNKNKLNVLDYGGSLGSSYFQCKKLLADMELQWNIVEQPNFVKTGIKYIQDDKLKFHYSINDCLRTNKPNVILLSGVLQCLEKPYDLILDICDKNIDYIIIDRTPFSKKEFITIQVVAPEIYPASYPLWIFNQNKLLDLFQNKYLLIFEFDPIDGAIKRFKNSIYFKGFFLKNKKINHSLLL